MEMTMTLRSEIERGIAGMGMNFSEFGEWSGINRGIFSAILNSNPPKPISLNQLERIGKALGHEEGWMFELYIDECFYDGRPNRRRVEPFLIRSAELDRIDCIEKVLSRLLEDLKQLDMIFEIGEALHTSGKIKESAVFYQCIVQNEKYHQSERLAVSHYRLFRAALGEDNERNLRAAIEFEPFCDKLPDHHRLDGLMRLINVYFSLDKRAEEEKYTREFFDFSHIVYHNEKPKIVELGDNYVPLNTEHPLIVYYGYSFLAMQSIMMYQEDYQKAEECIDSYEDLSWFVGLREQDQVEVEKFNFYSKANRLHIELLKGNFQIITPCLEFIKKHPSELLVFMSAILESANKFQYSIGNIIEEFSEKIDDYLNLNFNYDRIVTLKEYSNITYQAGIYFERRKMYDKAINYTLKCLETTTKIKNKDMFMKCVPLFEKLREWSSLEQTKRYEKILGGIL